MKKQQKIIALRTEAKRKVAEIETKIAFARSEAAEKRANLMIERAEDLDGLEADAKRFDVLARYRAKLAVVDARLATEVAHLKAEIQQTRSGCEQKCAEAADDPEPEKEPQQETVYCDGSEHSARIVAKRLINKMPHIPKGGSLNVNVIRDGCSGECFVSIAEMGDDKKDYISKIFFTFSESEKEEAEFVKKAREMFKSDDDGSNSHVAEPIASALDAVFGGNPMNNIPTLRKEADNE